MAPASGRDGAPVSDRLYHEAYRFDFFQAVRLLQAIGYEGAGEPGGRRYAVGYDHAPPQEAVRFRATPSHTFPAGPLRQIHRPPADPGQDPNPSPPEMLANFMGLTGPSGVLPAHYTSMVIERVREKDFSLRDFLDLFNHRVISLFYRAWEKYRFAIAYERLRLSAAEGGEDLFTQCLYSLVGLGTSGLRGRLDVDDEAFLYYAGHFAHRPRSPVALEEMLADYFGLPVELKQFQGQWLYLSREDQSCLPCPEAPRGRNAQLGASAVIGERVWDVEGKFRVRLGPLSYGDFCRFVPCGETLRPLCQLVRSYVGPQFDFDVQPVLRAAEVPWCRLGGDGADAARLGWNTWIRCRDFRHDVADAVFSQEGWPTVAGTGAGGSAQMEQPRDGG